MANTFVNLPAPAANGSGAEVDVSALGATKTIVVRIPQQLGVSPAQVLIEYSNDNAFQIWNPLVMFTKAGTQTVSVAARYLRATVVNYSGAGAPVVNVGASDGEVTFAELIAPAGNGQGAAVDVSAMPGFKTIQINGTFKGVCNIEVSVDAGTSYATVASFTQKGGTWSGTVYGNRMRISRSGILAREANPGTFTCDIGACELAGGGGGATVTVLEGSLQGDGSAESPLGAHVFKWSEGVTWEEIYASMSEVPGPKICLVEATADGLTMTAGTFNINDIYFWGMAGPWQGFLDTNGFRQCVVNVADGFVMEASVDPDNDLDVIYLRARDIEFNIAATTTVLYTLAGFNQANFLLEGCRLISANRIGIGRTIFVLSGSTLESGGAGLISATTGGNAIVMTAGGETQGVIFQDDGGAWNAQIQMDSSAKWGNTVVSAPGTKSVLVRTVAYRSSDARLYRITVDGAGALAVTLDN